MSQEVPKFETFEEFWPYYVSQHMNPVCRKLHFAGTSLAIASLIASPLFPPALIGAPIGGYGFAWIGHFFFENNKPATFSYPLWSLRGDFRMYKLTWQRKMGAELERARAMFGGGSVDAEPVRQTV